MINLYSLHSNKEKLDFYLEYGQLITGIMKYEKGNYDPIMHIIKRCPKLIYTYARDVIKGRWIEAEPYIMKDPQYAYLYAYDIIKGRWAEAESYIMQKPEYAVWYARFVVKGRWEEAEEYIKTKEDCWKVYCGWKDYCEGMGIDD